MATPPKLASVWARCAFIGLALFWAAAGWYVVLEGGFASTPKRSVHTVFVAGWGAVVMAATMLLLAVVSGSVVLQSLRARPAAYAMLALLVFAPPLVYALRM